MMSEIGEAEHPASKTVLQKSAGTNPFLPGLVFEAWYQQRVFRQLMSGFSEPGLVQTVPEQISALHALLPTLVDGAVTLSDPHGLLSAEQRVQLECEITTVQKAHFVVVRGDLPPHAQPCIGTLESPEQGATLLICIDNARGDVASSPDQSSISLNLSGPGIKDMRSLSVRGLDPGWLSLRQQCNSEFPKGIDVVLLFADQFVALPRSTQVRGL